MKRRQISLAVFGLLFFGQTLFAGAGNQPRAPIGQIQLQGVYDLGLNDSGRTGSVASRKFAAGGTQQEAGGHGYTAGNCTVSALNVPSSARAVLPSGLYQVYQNGSNLIAVHTTGKQIELNCTRTLFAAYPNEFGRYNYAESATYSAAARISYFTQLTENFSVVQGQW